MNVTHAESEPGTPMVGITPGEWKTLSRIKTAARLSLGLVWLWEGLVPKVIFPSPLQVEMVRTQRLVVGFAGADAYLAGLGHGSGRTGDHVGHLRACGGARVQPLGAGAHGARHRHQPGGASRSLRRTRQGCVPLHLRGAGLVVAGTIPHELTAKETSRFGLAMGCLINDISWSLEQFRLMCSHRTERQEFAGSGTCQVPAVGSCGAEQIESAAAQPPAVYHHLQSANNPPDPRPSNQIAPNRTKSHLKTFFLDLTASKFFASHCGETHARGVPQ